MANQPLQHSEQFEIPKMGMTEVEVQPVLSDADVIRAGFDLIFQNRGEAAISTERALTPEIEAAIIVNESSANIREMRQELLTPKKAA